MVVGLGMEPDVANLIEHLNGLIFMARVTWQLSSGKCADIARTFRFVGHMHQAAAVARRDDQLSGLHISEDVIP
jgi:hypothetical protein